MPDRERELAATTDDFTVRLYDALVATLVREGKAVDDTDVGQSRAAIQAITPLLGELIGEAAVDQRALDEIVNQVCSKIGRISALTLARQKTPRH